ncbi:MAG: Stk1 family PASTA domain-containing Ser/Thr kinase [Eubacteriales bacterium]|nr:Stk1 family PASTA domain-containing Ser/Thr kinase [Eubacteriales bacterium]
MKEYEYYIGRLLDNRYEIQSLIGIGGMAFVYKAFCHRLNRFVAVKILRDEFAQDEEFRRRFMAESHAIAMLSHPNIVAVYDVSHSDDVEYIVMELVEGITLKQYMDKKGALPWKETVHFSKQIAKALSHAHERGIIHRDIKPQNLMLLKDGTIKVADFGIAALEDQHNEDSTETIGSIHYIAPEQAYGEDPDARSDIYSLGIVMYEMLAAQKPYTGKTIAEIAVKHMSIEPTPISKLRDDVPERLEEIVRKAMSADVENRYQSADELHTALNRFTQSQIMAAQSSKYENPAVMPVRSVSELSKDKYAVRKKRSRRVAFMSGTLGALLSVVGLFAFLWSFWLNDVFSPAERIPLPNFIGKNYEELVGNSELEAAYNFNVTYVIDTKNESGRIMSQNPEAGRSMMITPEGINVELTVSTGVVLTPVPDVLGMDYREATLELQKAGLTVELENATSQTVAKDLVVNSSPAAGEQISAGSTVYIVVSTGAEVSYITMPNLIGLSEDAAINKLQGAGFSFAGSERVSGDVEAGTVIWQSIAAFTDAEEHSGITLRISSGPWG